MIRGHTSLVRGSTEGYISHEKGLQKENEKLKRKALIRTREQTKKASQEGEGEKKEKKVASEVHLPGVTSDPVAKLASENERLGRSLRREMERNQQLQLSLKTAQLERDRLESQVHMNMLQHFICGTWESSGRYIHGW